MSKDIDAVEAALRTGFTHLTPIEIMIQEIVFKLKISIFELKKFMGQSLRLNFRSITAILNKLNK